MSSPWETFEMSKYVRPPAVEYSAEQVWAAAVAATRINGGYLKDAEMQYQDSAGNPLATPIELKQSNKHLMRDILAYESKFSTKPEDVVEGNACRAHFQGLLFKELAGHLTNGFLKAIFQNANRETFLSNQFIELAQIAAAPNGWKRDVKREEIIAKAGEGQHIGHLGDKVAGEVEITQSNFSQNYGIFFNHGFMGPNAVFFANKEGLEPGKKFNIKGTVKAHRDNNVTQLNRVKVEK
jgi:hypothetical protein